MGYTRIYIIWKNPRIIWDVLEKIPNQYDVSVCCCWMWCSLKKTCFDGEKLWFLLSTSEVPVWANVQVHNLAEWSRLFLNKLGSPRGEPGPTFRDEQRYTSTLCPRENVHGIHVDNQKCIEMHIDSIEPQLHLNLSKSFFFTFFDGVEVRLQFG